MAAKKKRLGRGLDVLLSKPAAESAAKNEDGLRQIPLDLLQRGQYQPRIDIRKDTLEDLAGSIRAQGVVQPIVARPLPAVDGVKRYEIGRSGRRILRRHLNAGRKRRQSRSRRRPGAARG